MAISDSETNGIWIKPSSGGPGASAPHVCRCGHDRDDHQSKSWQERGEKFYGQVCQCCECRSYIEKGGLFDSLIESMKSSAERTVEQARDRVLARMRFPSVSDYQATKAAEEDREAVDALIRAVQSTAPITPSTQEKK